MYDHDYNRLMMMLLVSCCNQIRKMKRVIRARAIQVEGRLNVTTAPIKILHINTEDYILLEIISF